MKKNYIFKFIIFSLLFIGSSCNFRNSSTPVKKEDLIGTWSNLSMEVTFQNKDSTFMVPEGQWEDILKIKPILTTFNHDNSYESKYYNLQDSLLFISKGNWELKEDSLYLKEAGVITVYQVILDLPKATFTGQLDWDQDGNIAEVYKGVQIKNK